MIEIGQESYIWTKEEKRIPQERHHVPGLGNISHYTYTRSSAPCALHFHPNIIEIHCIVKGQRNAVLEKNGEMTKYFCQGNQAFITYPFEVHSNGSDPALPHEFYAFQLNTVDPHALLGLDAECSFSLYKNLCSLSSRHLSVGNTQLSYLSSAFNLFAENTPESIHLGVALLISFLFSLNFMLPAESNTHVSSLDPAIRKSLEYLYQHLSEDIRLSTLADISGYSLSRYKVLFKNEMGITPAEYINLRKFEMAKKMLTESNASITDLSYMLGFSSASYFCAVFKKYAMITPQSYRSRYSSIPELK